MSRRIVDHHYADRAIMVDAPPRQERKQHQHGRDERARSRGPRPLPPSLAPLATLATPAEVDTAYQGTCPRGRSHVLHILHLGGRWRLFCTKGCSEGDILKTIGRPPDVLRYRPPAEPRPPKERRYEYPERDGQPAFHVIRRLDVPSSAPGRDRFCIRQSDGRRVESRKAPDWCKGVVYRLDELLRTPIEEAIFWCEGEKDVESLRDLGLNAVTTSCGADSYKGREARWFQGRAVVILPDNDRAGEQYAKSVLHSLQGVAAKVVVVRLPGLPPKGDVTDWLANGGKVEDLLKSAEVPDFFKPVKAAAPPPPRADPTKTPLGSVETAILTAIAEHEHRSLTTDALPMLVAGLAGEERWNARAHEPIIRYPAVPKEELAKARAGISRALGSLARRGLVTKDGRWVRLTPSAPVRTAPRVVAPTSERQFAEAREHADSPFERPVTCRQCGTLFDGTEKQARKAEEGKSVFCRNGRCHEEYARARRQRAARRR